MTDPPADSPSGPAGGRSARRSEYVEALVEVALDPAVGLAARVFDPLGDDPQGLDRCRTIAMEAITSVALHRSGRADASVTDDHVREVRARRTRTRPHSEAVAMGSWSAGVGRPRR